MRKKGDKNQKAFLNLLISKLKQKLSELLKD